MRRIAPTALMALALLPAAVSAQQLTEVERKHLVSYMQETQEKLLAATAELTAEQWSFKPAPEAWSVAQVLEHIVVSEKLMMGIIKEQALQSEPLTEEQKAEAAAKTEKIMPMMLDRSQKFQAPEMAQPQGQFGKDEAIAEAFDSSRNQTIEFVRATEADLHGHGFEHPAFGMINGHQWLVLLAGHCERHLMQIEEVKAHPDFPKKNT